MAKLKVPSIQHLARNWRPDSGAISSSLVRVASNPPYFNYNKLFAAAFDLIYLKQPEEEVIKGIARHEKRDDVRKNLLEVVPLLASHFSNISPDFVNPVSTRFYPVSQSLLVPFKPPFVYGVGGQLHFPWLSFWRSNPLRDKNLSLFATLVREILDDDPDLESAKFEILDFSAPPKCDRVLNVISADDIPRLDDEAKVEMLAVFEEGFLKAEAVLAGQPNRQEKNETKSKSDEESDDDSAQYELFDR